MSYESSAEPIKLGYLFDFKLPEGFPQEARDDLVQPFELVFRQGMQQGLIDRPVEVIFREVEGLPKGTIKAVIDGFADLVEQGCLAVFGPAITDNCVPVREEIEQRFHVPAISVTGTDDWLGEWTFSLPMGSMTDEPIFWSDLVAKQGISEVGVLVEQSLVGDTYVRNFRRACAAKGIRIVAEVPISQTAQDITEAVRKLYEAKAPAVVHCGFGFGIVTLQRSAQGTRLGSARGSWAPRSRTRGSTRTALGGDPGLDGPRPVRRDEPGRPAISRRVRSRLRPAPAILRAGGQPRPRHRLAARLRRRQAAHAPGRQGCARAGEDAARGQRIRRDEALVRQMDPPGVDGRRLPRRETARRRVRPVPPGGPVRGGVTG